MIVGTKKAMNMVHPLGFLLILGLLQSQAAVVRYNFVVQETTYKRLCKSKSMLTVNGQFPGPTIYANKGDTIIVDVQNQGPQNITIHWHGVKQPRYPWSDGPEFITQCPIQPGKNFSQKVFLSDEEGTLWWHAHSDWTRATVHGLIVIYPKNGTSYPFPKPDGEVPIVLAEWWRHDVQAVLQDFLRTGGDPNSSDALTINGQPGDLYPCSRSGTYKVNIDRGKTYLIRMVNAAMNLLMFLAVADHKLTVVGTDGAYTKPLTTSYITISPGQTMDLLLEANQPLDRYYMAARPYNSQPLISFDNTTTTAIFEYNGNYTPSSRFARFPKRQLPKVNNTNASVNFTGSLRSLADREHPIDVPVNVTRKFLFTISVNTLPCPNNSCEGPRGLRFAASVNNISFDSPGISILQAWYQRINGVYGDDFPNFPPLRFNYTSSNLNASLQTPTVAREVEILRYNEEVELVFQGTNLVAGVDHPMHLHGHSFYVVGWGLGNFDKINDPLKYNLVDPPYVQTTPVPKNGWTAIRFKANNPGVWLLHCHLERHITWGMEMVFITMNGRRPDEKILPPPPDFPPC